MKRPRRSTSLLGLAALALTLTAVVVVPRLGDEEATAPPPQAVAAPPPASPSPSRTGPDPEAELVHPFHLPSPQLPGVLGPDEGAGVLGPESVQVPTPPTRTEAPRAVIRPA